jgi:hypothetical protein
LKKLAVPSLAKVGKYPGEAKLRLAFYFEVYPLYSYLCRNSSIN